VDIRVGEYEALEEKLRTPEFCPDFGPARFNARSGATVVGARDFLIAYNINLNSRDPRIAKDIALVIRDKGRFQRDQAGKKIRGADGIWLLHPGMFQHCKATGWYIADYRCAQVTMNLTNFRETPVHQVFDAVCALAAERGCRVTGSEIVGLVPLDVMLSAGDHYLARSGASRGVNESERVDMAIRSLGLTDVAAFDPAKKVVEYRIGPRSGELMSLACSAFVDETASDSPAPGGGSVAALCGALSAALTAMVGVLTYGKKGFGEVALELERLGQRAQALKHRFSRAVDDDTAAFNRVMGAMRLPRQTPEEEAIRNAALEAATQGAILVPLSVLEDSVEAAQLAAEMVRIGNPNSVSDAGVASLCARVAARGAHYNVLINVPGSTDEGFVREVKERAERAWAEAAATCDATESAMLTKLHPQPQP
jgi:glutamate formiminotransferase/formiminotetrahydrofolate cyclodeaminase